MSTPSDDEPPPPVGDNNSAALVEEGAAAAAAANDGDETTSSAPPVSLENLVPAAAEEEPLSQMQEPEHGATTSTTTNNDDKARKSLNAVYGNRRGFWSSLSLILNAGLMVYAHVGLSAVIVSNQERIQESNNNNNNNNDAVNNNNTNITISNNGTDFVPTGRCTVGDLQVWQAGGAANKTAQSNWCARRYDDNGNGGNGCLLDAACTARCFVQVWNYSPACAQCFADIPFCGLQQGCAFICQQDGESAECSACNEPCDASFDACSGLPRPQEETAADDNNNTATTNETATAAPTDDNKTDLSLLESPQETCARQQEGVDADAIDQFYTVYELKFFSAIETAWTSDARLLAVIVVVFSGFWPYAKNVLLALAWYLPLTVHRRDWLLTWLRRLGKYTLVDVYVIVMLMVGVLLEINVADGVPVVIKAEPRPAIIAFLVATVWEFVQIEWMVSLHEELWAEQDRRDKMVRTVPTWYRNGVRTNSFPARAGMWLLWVVATGLYLSGSILEAVRFTSVLGGEARGCDRAYNLYEIGTAMVSDFFLLANDAAPGVWTMTISYMLFLAVFPLYCHLVHMLSFLFNIRQRQMCIIADQCWTFASVEVLVLAIFTVEYKFSDLIASLAGNEGAQFFGIETQLGPGFFILIAYSVFGGLVHYFFNMRLLLDSHDAEEKRSHSSSVEV